MKSLKSLTLVLLIALLAAAFSIPPTAMAAEKQFDAHRPYASLHFKDQEMDFALALILGAAVNGGAEIGECFYTAARIKEGDAAGWQNEWLAMAQRVERRGQKALAGGHKASAISQFRRACYYYRAALISMLPTDKRFKETAERMRGLLIKAGKLQNPPLEYIEIPFEGTVLPGYFRAAGRGRPAKTLLMLGGGETFAEDQVFYIEPKAHKRGYNFLTVDLPGQGLLPLEGKVFRADVEKPMKAVVDYALGRREVDPARLAAYGISGGGGFVPKAATSDNRIQAVVMNSATVDGRRLFAAMPVSSATEDVMAGFSTFKRNTIRVIAWRWGVAMDNIPGLVPANKGFGFDPAKLACPALILLGEGEYGNEEVRRQQEECMAKLPTTQKKMVVTPANEGASNHCIIENRGLMSQVVFDWLDGVLKKK